MQYFSFVGLGPKQGYEELIYTFENDPTVAEVSKFVQYPIYKKHKEEIDQVFLFFTKESKARYEEEILKELDFKNIVSIHMDQNIDFESFVATLARYVESNAEIMVDMTHSFRQIPMRMLFALKYIQIMKNCEVKHLYYGMVTNQNEDNKREGLIIDNINDFRNQEVTEYLSQFNNTLIIQPQDWKDLVEPDEKILRFLNALARFNEMVELCEFDSSVESVQKIVESSRSIEKEPDKYRMILPLTQKIREKFEEVSNQVLLKNKKKNLIQVLLKHRRFQNAITFVDEFLREECVHQALDPTAKKLEVLALANKCHIKPDNFIYTVSQFLFKKADIRKDEGGNPKLDSIVADSSHASNVIQVLKNNRRVIRTFLNEIRNKMNHGTTIKLSGMSLQEVEEQIVESIYEMINVVDQL